MDAKFTLGAPDLDVVLKSLPKRKRFGTGWSCRSG